MKLILRVINDEHTTTSIIHIDNLSGSTLWTIYKKAQGIPFFLPLRCKTLKVWVRNETYKVIVIDKDVYYYYLYECKVIMSFIETKVIITLAIRLDLIDKSAEVTYNPDVTNMHHIVKRALLKVETHKSWV